MDRIRHLGWIFLKPKLENGTAEQDIPSKVLKPTQPNGGIVWYAATENKLRFQHPKTTTSDDSSTPRARDDVNRRGCMLHWFEIARYQVQGTLMLCGHCSCSRRNSLTHFWAFFLQS